MRDGLMTVHYLPVLEDETIFLVGEPMCCHLRILLGIGRVMVFDSYLAARVVSPSHASFRRSVVAPPGRARGDIGEWKIDGLCWVFDVSSTPNSKSRPKHALPVGLV